MLVLVCGGRDFTNYELLKTTLDRIHKARGITHIIHGGARGADTLASGWAFRNKIRTTVFKADWDKYGRSAGPRRNEEMADIRPSLVVAFPGGPGTANMVKVAQDRKIPVVFAKGPTKLQGKPKQK